MTKLTRPQRNFLREEIGLSGPEELFPIEELRSYGTAYTDGTHIVFVDRDVPPHKQLFFLYGMFGVVNEKVVVLRARFRGVSIYSGISKRLLSKYKRWALEDAMPQTLRVLGLHS